MTNSEAIDVLMEQKRYVHENSVPDQALDMGIKALKNERKKGRWLPYLEEYHDMFKCSNCGNITRVPFKCFSPPYCYCPNCGADMREEKADG